MRASKVHDPMKESIQRLSVEDIRELRDCLPAPVSAWKSPEAEFMVYRTKALLNPQWASDALLRLLVDIRGSYYVYGDRPPLDAYDLKAVPYLVRATYRHPTENWTHLIEEWLSDRLVPGVGEPLGGGELELFSCDGESTEEMLRRKCFASGGNLFEHTVTSNRMCAINPYFVNKEGEESGAVLPHRQRYTAVCYALMAHHFWKDHLENSPYRYTTSILQTAVVQKSMTLYAGGESFPNIFTPAYEFMHLEKPESVRINRNAHNGVAYEFPLYFLNIRELVALLQRLLAENVLSREILCHYLGEDTLSENSETGIASDVFKKLRHVGKLLKEEGFVFGGTIQGKTLRAFVDREVSDGPELKITHIQKTYESACMILKAAGLSYCRQ